MYRLKGIELSGSLKSRQFIKG